MAGDTPRDAAKALEYKEQGNKCFQAEKFIEAEAFYSKAIDCDPNNVIFFTNRAMAKLHFDPPVYNSVITDAETSIRLLPQNMKAYYFLAQAQIGLQMYTEALESGKIAHGMCVEECRRVPMGKGSSSIGPITELVLRCKKEWWEDKEQARLSAREGLEKEILAAFTGMGVEGKEDEVRALFDRAGRRQEDGKPSEDVKREVPSWCLDAISFSVMLDPVVTKAGKSYERASIMEHLKRNPSDPVSREPMTMADLRPNLMLKEAIDEFLKNNGWAVDW